MSCQEEKQDVLCESTCDNEKIIGNVENVTGKIIYLDVIETWIIETHPDFINSPGYSPSDEFALVPCNLGEGDKIENMTVVLSGRKLNCCKLITLPHLRFSWGCKFEITSITPLTDLD